MNSGWKAWILTFSLEGGLDLILCRFTGTENLTKWLPNEDSHENSNQTDNVSVTLRVVLREKSTLSITLK